MNVKEYLNQARYIDRQIDAKLEHQEKLNSIIYKATSTISDMPGSPTRDIAKRERAIAKVIDLEKEIDDEIDRLVDKKREIKSLINKIENSEYALLLELRYVNISTWEQIADILGISLRSVYRMHGAALIEADYYFKKM
ncbi:MAG: DUF1492 domain-containing protein [Mogibacterium sp.]|nr:DUF1492 domain-containing protein [Mogibacterium sp.]MBR0380303.1 DUF1492 domain-containing protein [Mogibacterium sp.]